jgi:hypothetical protein
MIFSDKAAPTNSDFVNLNVTGATGDLLGRMILGSDNVVSAANLNLPTVLPPINSAKLIVSATPTAPPASTPGQLNIATPNIPAGATLQVDSARVNVTGTSTGGGNAVVNGGVLNVTGSLASLAGVNVTGGEFQAGATQTVRKLSISGGQARVLPGERKVLTVGDNTADYSSPANRALSIADPGKLDLTTNGLIVDHAPGADTEAMKSVRGLIIQGYNGGDWQGNGITSTDAAAEAASRAIGYAYGSEAAPGGTFLGQAADSSSVVARFTVAGDASLDGKVDFTDLVALAQNYGTTVSDVTESWWYRGDFNYDGKVDFVDLVRLAQNYDTSLPEAAIPGATVQFEQDLAKAFAQVPEPSSVVLAGLAALAFAGRRRSRQ